MSRCVSAFARACTSLRRGLPALLSALLVLAAVPALADYVVPDEGLPQMQPTGLEARSIVEDITVIPPLERAFDFPRIAVLGSARHSHDFLPVRGLDDPENYWAGQYTDYDRWLYEHYFPYLREKHIYEELKAELLAQAGAAESDWVYVSVEVDKAGFMLPSSVSWERRRARLPQGPLSEMLRQPWTQNLGYERLWQMPCAGVMPAEVRARMEHDRALLLAADYPAIPQWLGLNPSAWVIFLPGPLLLCSGELGSYVELERFDANPEYFMPARPDSWRRFSQDGTLLGPVDAQSPEIQYRSLGWRSGHQAGTYTVERSSQWNPDEYDLRTDWFRARMRREPDPQTGRLTANPLYATDLLGNPLDLNAPLPAEYRNYYRPVDGEFIRWLYQAQLELGITSGNAGPDGC